MPKNTQSLHVCTIVLIFSVRAFLGFILVFLMQPLCVDDYFRVFHAQFWWNNLSFTSSNTWLPGYLYFYGPIVGFFNDMIAAPRIFTLFFHLATGWIIYKGVPGSRWAKTASLCYWFFSPLGYVLSVAPLSESMTVFFLSLHLFFLITAQKKENFVFLLMSSFFLLLITMVRYEGWILVPVFAFFAWKVPVLNISAPIKGLIISVPLFFPVVWMLYSHANWSDAFIFLRSTKDDHFGTTSLIGLITSRFFILTIFQLLLFVLLLLNSKVFSFLKNVKEFPVYLSYFVIISALVLMMVLFDAMPSQFSARMLYYLVFISGVFFGLLLEKAFKKKFLVIAVGLLIGVAGFYSAIKLESGVEKADLEVASWIEEKFSHGALEENDLVVIANELPCSAALLVFSNRANNVLIDGIDGDLKNIDKNTKLVIFKKASREERIFAKKDWVLIQDFNKWVVYSRNELSSDVNLP